MYFRTIYAIKINPVKRWESAGENTQNLFSAVSETNTQFY